MAKKLASKQTEAELEAESLELADRLRRHTEQLRSLHNDMAKESDRSGALLAASLIDERLKEMLEGFLAPVRSTKDLLDDMKPLGTFSSRIAMCHSLSLIHKAEYVEINLIRSIRNDFAHRFRPLTFEDSLIKSKAMKLPAFGFPEANQETSRHRSCLLRLI